MVGVHFISEARVMIIMWPYDHALAGHVFFDVEDVWIPDVRPEVGPVGLSGGRVRRRKGSNL